MFCTDVSQHKLDCMKTCRAIKKISMLVSSSVTFELILRLTGELKHSIDEALGQQSQQSTESRIQQLLKDNPVMLFMKGETCTCTSWL